MVQLVLTAQLCAVAGVLQFFDQDGSGFITVDELQSALKEHGDAAVVAAHISEILQDVDKDKVSNNSSTRRVIAHRNCCELVGLFELACGQQPVVDK